MQINYEDFFRGKISPGSCPMMRCNTSYQTAEIDYWLPPLMLESGTVSVKPGSIVYLPRASRVVWRVTSEEP